MLQKLNEKIQGLIAWVIILLVAITFAMFGIEYYIQSKRDGLLVAEVNGQPIFKQDFDLQFRRLSQLKNPMQWSNLRENQLKAQVLNDLILNSISMQSAKINGFAVTPAQANAAIFGIPQFQADGQFSSMKYAQALNGAFFTPESFQHEVEQGMVLNQQRFAFIGTAFALPHEIEQYVKLYMQKRDYAYTQIPALKFVDKVDVKEAEVQSFYNKHQDVFLSPEKLSVKYIQLSLPAIKEKIVLDEKEMRQYYNDHQTQFMLPAQWDLENIVIGFSEQATQEEQARALKFAQKLSARFQKDSQEFKKFAAKVAKGEFNQDGFVLSTAVLPTIFAGQTNLDTHLININKSDMVTDPVRTAKGYELFKCNAYQPSRFKAFEDVATVIKEQLLNEKAQVVFSKNMDKLSELSFQHPDSLEKIAKKLNLEINESGLFTRRGGKDSFTQNKLILKAAFSPDVLKYHNNSEPVQLDHDNVVVLRLAQHVPASKQALVDVKLLIAKKLAKKQAEAEARKMGEMLLAYRKYPERHKHELTAAPNLAWKSIDNASRDAADVPAGVNELAFSLPAVGSRSGRTLVGGDYVVVELKQVHPGDMNLLDPEQIASITQQIEANYGMMDYDLYVHHITDQASVVRH